MPRHFMIDKLYFKSQVQAQLGPKKKRESKVWLGQGLGLGSFWNKGLGLGLDNISRSLFLL